MRLILLILLALTPLFANGKVSTPDTVQHRFDVTQDRCEVYLADTMMFSDVNDTVRGIFLVKSAVKFNTALNRIEVTVMDSVSIYRISNEQEQIISGISLRVFYIIDSKVRIVVLDPRNTIYFIRQDGQMMILPRTKKIIRR
jgi:hypothetical protein